MYPSGVAKEREWVRGYKLYIYIWDRLLHLNVNNYQSVRDRVHMWAHVGPLGPHSGGLLRQLAAWLQMAPCLTMFQY